jgi:hypothetical protein
MIMMMIKMTMMMRRPCVQMVVEVDVARLQARVSRLYQEGTRHNQERIKDISRRARSPGRGSQDSGLPGGGGGG